jgi:hypothetical protein
MNGMDVMIIEKTTSSTDKLAKSKANYEKTYYRYLALFNDCGRHANFLRIG